jgi:hypothetical protein
MSRVSNVLSFLAAATILVAGMAKGPAVASAASSMMSEAFWKCPSGYTFEVSGSAVHCKKPAWTETKAFMPCVLATPTLKVDLLGNTDMCAGSVGVTVTAEPVCYPTDIANGFTKRLVSGKDFCGKTHPAEVIAPNQMITF